MKVKNIAFAVAFLGLSNFAGSALAQNAKDQPFDTDAFIAFFDRLIFDSRHLPVSKWVKPIRFRFLGGISLERRNFIERFAYHLSYLTTHPMEMAAENNANVFIVSSPDPQSEVFEGFRKLAESVIGPEGVDDLRKIDSKALNCLVKMAHDWSDKGAAFRSAILFFNSKSSEKQLTICITVMLPVMLGFSSRPIPGAPSVFGTQTRTGQLTDYDRKALRYLYRPQIKVGMHRKEALRILRKLLSDDGF